MAELKNVRDFKFEPTWSHSKEQHEFEVKYLGGAIGVVWQTRGGKWTHKRANRTAFSTRRFINRIAAARALADEPIANPATRYPKKKRTRRKSLTAAELLDSSADELWEGLVDALAFDWDQTQLLE